jgi:hypothetical protein
MLQIHYLQGTLNYIYMYIKFYMYVQQQIQSNIHISYLIYNNPPRYNKQREPITGLTLIIALGYAMWCPEQSCHLQNVLV